MENNPPAMPAPVSPTLIPTLNMTGFMTTWIDPYTEAFLNFAPEAPGPCLEIGAAYGNATLAALATGVEVIALDPDEGHLRILAEKVPPNQKDRLQLLQGRLPIDIPVENDSIGAILCSRVLHFLSGDEIDRSVRTMFDLMKAGGKVFLIADSPYMGVFGAFRPLYDARKQSGDLWPGRIENFPDYVPEALAPSVPDFFHVLDPDILTRVCESAGFVVERTEFISREDYLPAARFDGREGVGIVAVKP
jgi:hypothetical protein